MTPSPGVPVSARMRPNDAYFELIADTIDGLEPSARAQFLQRFFYSLAHVDVPENRSISLWDDVVARRLQLSEHVDSPVSLHTALVDVLSANGYFQLPVVLEFDDLKNLHRSAVTDSLTGLYNRRLFNEIFDKELNRAHRYGHPVSLVTLDLHRFKEVNDKHGHPRGDDVLRAAANTLRKALRTSDSAFRVGGDEFNLLLPQTDSSQASALSRRIGIVFSEILRPLGLTVSVSMDHGVATFPQDGDNREQLIRIADERLYASKKANQQGTVPESQPTPAVSGEIPPEAAPSALPSSTPPAAGEAQPTVPVPSSHAETVAASPVSAAPAPEPPAVITPEPKVQPSPETASAPSISPEPIAPDSFAPASPESAAPPEPTVITLPPPATPAASPLHSAPPSFPLAAEEPRLYAVPRKAERVSMSGTNAYAVLPDQPSQRAKVVDLGFGGVALDFAAGSGIPDSLLAVLHVPILPPVRVNLRRVWSKQLNEETVRVGCCFVS